jgi:hypothetical protein
MAALREAIESGTLSGVSATMLAERRMLAGEDG